MTPLLLVAVVHALDAEPLSRALRDAGHGFTRLRSEGGYLEAENATLLLGVDDGAVADVVDIFRRVCKEREVDVPLVLRGSLREWRNSVSHRGAKIFVLPLRDVFDV
jgi:uncharacterized protein YaaQ